MLEHQRLLALPAEQVQGARGPAQAAAAVLAGAPRTMHTAAARVVCTTLHAPPRPAPFAAPLSCPSAYPTPHPRCSNIFRSVLLPRSGAIPKRKALPGLVYNMYEDPKKGTDATRIRQFIEVWAGGRVHQLVDGSFGRGLCHVSTVGRSVGGTGMGVGVFAGAAQVQDTGPGIVRGWHRCT